MATQTMRAQVGRPRMPGHPRPGLGVTSSCASTSARRCETRGYARAPGLSMCQRRSPPQRGMRVAAAAAAAEEEALDYGGESFYDIIGVVSLGKQFLGAGQKPSHAAW